MDTYDDTLQAINDQYKNVLKIAHVNAQSLRRKRTNFSAFVQSCDENTIICINETWLNETDESGTWIFDKSKYCIIRKDRHETFSKKSKGGGSLILFPKKFRPQRQAGNECLLHNTETIWVEFIVNNTRFKLLLFYIPCENTVDQFSEILESSLETSDCKNIILIGDLNKNYTNKSISDRINTILSKYDLHVINQLTPTRIQNTSQTLIDYSISDHKDWTYFICDTPFKTDHLMTWTITKIRIQKEKMKARKIVIFDKRNYDPMTFKTELKNTDFNIIYTTYNPNKALNDFSKILHNTINKVAPLKTMFTRKKLNSRFLNAGEEIKKLRLKKKNVE